MHCNNSCNELGFGHFKIKVKGHCMNLKMSSVYSSDTLCTHDSDSSVYYTFNFQVQILILSLGEYQQEVKIENILSCNNCHT